MGNNAGSPSRFLASQSSFAPDAWPYTVRVHRGFANGTERVYAFLAARPLRWRMTQQNQRATRFSTGDRQLADMSLMNIWTWRELNRGGTGALLGGDTTRYRYSQGLFAGDGNEIKLQPVPYSAGTNWGTPDVNPGPNDRIQGILWQQDSEVPGGGRIFQFVSPSWPDASKGFRIWCCYDNSMTPRIITFYFHATSTSLNGWTDGAIGNVVLHKDKFYFTIWRSGKTWEIWRFWPEKAGAHPGWNLKQLMSGAPAPVGLNQMAHMLYSDGQYLYKAVNDQVYRTDDPDREEPAGTTNIKWSTPVGMGDGRMITSMQMYGDANEKALYCSTSYGLYRALEEVIPNDVNGKTELRRAYPVEIQPGASDHYLGMHMKIARGELLWNYAKGCYGTHWAARSTPHRLRITGIQQPTVEPSARSRMVSVARSSVSIPWSERTLGPPSSIAGKRAAGMSSSRCLPTAYISIR